MLVAGDRGAYGSAEKSVFVRQPLMILPTMPRVVGPGEEVSVPVSVFVLDATVRNVALTIEPDSYFAAVGDKTTQIAFSRPDEKVGMLRLKAASRLGKSHVPDTGSSGEHHAQSDILIDVPSSNPPTTQFVTPPLQPRDTY